MPTTDVNALALAALSQAMADPEPRPLLGSKAKPGMFLGSAQAVKAAAQQAAERGWFEETGTFEGQGRSKKPLYRITPAGIAHVLEHGPAAQALRDMLIALDGQTRRLERLQADVAAAAELMRAQTQAVQQLLARSKSPVAAAAPASTTWTGTALACLAEHRRRNPYGRCTLAELYQKVASGRGISIGQFHDGVRSLVTAGKISLHPFTGAAYQLENEQYALVAGQEIKYYVDLVAEG